jgi:hypothetical protein
LARSELTPKAIRLHHFAREVDSKGAGSRLYLAHLQYGDGITDIAQEGEPAETGAAVELIAIII